MCFCFEYTNPGKGFIKMAKKGKLKVQDFGYTMPVSDPAHCSPPFLYRGIEAFTIVYETDYESAAQMLPEPLEFSSDPPVAGLMMSNLTFSNFGPYKEAILMFNVIFKNKNYLYIPNLFVTQEDPLIGGREIWGYAKKLADMEFKKERNQIISWVERPSGNRLFTATVSPETNLKLEDWQNTDILSLKKIPSAEEGKKPDVCQLVGCEFKLTPILGSDGIAELWRCKGSLTFDSQSRDDAWHRAPVVNILDAIYGWFNIHLPYGYLVHDYLA